MTASTLRIIPALAVLSMAACSSATDLMDDENPPIRTEYTEYVARHVPGQGRIDRDDHHQFNVVARYENRTGAPVYLSHCDGVRYSLFSEEDSPAYNPRWACPATPPIQVGVGEVRVDTIQLRGPNRYDGYTGEPFGTLEGRFWLVYEIGSCPDVSRCLLPEEERRSNTFHVLGRRKT